ncbi:hypothetical protein F0L74_05905 [Chitinophaga agrisoli]|uniref:DUF6046 domain-containing protein n=1 Tax=Chitinophaga agrisoli TaxID=2607653 RepID=A0A5B2W455_9BACT|nr:DUF6046 domain-containing protein [Chitinophaga agrisoli]KAA2245490.1 hypothetical protein F0L74_05905 [Chitinophaga agrisoli]
MAVFDLREIFERVFGYSPPPEPPEFPDAPPRLETSILAQPYYLEDAVGREFFMPVTIDGYLIPFAVMSMYWKKTYISTSMPERGGSVKELISIDDYVFEIRGICLNDGNDFPEQDIIDLHNLFKKNSSVTMRSALSAIVLKGEFDERVIIRDVRWPDMQGVQHARAFEMTVESDMIFELEISQ